jgi:hypothetical protein
MEKPNTPSMEISNDAHKIFDDLFPLVFQMVSDQFSKKRKHNSEKDTKTLDRLYESDKRKVRVKDLTAEWKETKNSFQEISSEIDDILIRGHQVNFWKNETFDGLDKMEKLIGDLDDHVCECEEKLLSLFEKIEA